MIQLGRAAASGGYCAAGQYSVAAPLPIRYQRTSGSHHQMIWAVGKRDKTFSGGVGPVKVSMSTPAGKAAWTAQINFTKAKHLQSGQYAFSPGGVLRDASSNCGYDFTIHHS